MATYGQGVCVAVKWLKVCVVRILSLFQTSVAAFLCKAGSDAGSVCVQVQRSDPEHLLGQRDVPCPSAHRLLCNQGTSAGAVGPSECLSTCVLTWASLQAFVDFFSRGLQEEYRRQGIIIQVSWLPDHSPGPDLLLIHS